jgi:hypothetical protein
MSGAATFVTELLELLPLFAAMALAFPPFAVCDWPWDCFWLAAAEDEACDVATEEADEEEAEDDGVRVICFV